MERSRRIYADKNDLRDWTGHRRWAREHLCANTMASFNRTTRRLVCEIRTTEKKLDRSYRYLPQAGFYQGIQK